MESITEICDKEQRRTSADEKCPSIYPRSKNFKRSQFIVPNSHKYREGIERLLLIFRLIMWYGTVSGALSDEYQTQDLREAQQRSVKSSMTALCKSDRAPPGLMGLDMGQDTRIPYS